MPTATREDIHPPQHRTPEVPVTDDVAVAICYTKLDLRSAVHCDNGELKTIEEIADILDSAPENKFLRFPEQDKLQIKEHLKNTLQQRSHHAITVFLGQKARRPVALLRLHRMARLRHSFCSRCHLQRLPSTTPTLRKLI